MNVVQHDVTDLVSRRFTVDDCIIAAELDSELVLLNIEAGIYFGLDTMGTTIWHLIENGLDESQIKDHLLNEFDVTEETVQSDLKEFLGQLIDKGILHVVEV